MAELFKVTNVVKRVKLTATGEFIDVYEVFFTTKSGIEGSIEVPVELFSKEKVREMIEKEASEIEGVMNL